MAAGKKTQLQLEDTVLHLLSTATGSLLDNIELINTLDASKTTWEEVNESLRVAEETTRQIEVASAQYRPCSTRAAILYFVLNDLAGALTWQRQAAVLPAVSMGLRSDSKQSCAALHKLTAVLHHLVAAACVMCSY